MSDLICSSICGLPDEFPARMKNVAFLPAGALPVSYFGIRIVCTQPTAARTAMPNAAICVVLKLTYPSWAGPGDRASPLGE